MMSSGQLAFFILAGLALNVTPGPDVLYIVSSTLRSGLRAGVAAALGIVSGCFIHIFAAALGITALVAASAAIFSVLKFIGAAYLLYIGIRMVCAGRTQVLAADAGGDGQRSLAAIWRRGFLTNALNPKVALFFLAFVPQFIPPSSPHPAFAFLALGLLFNFNSLFVNFGWAMAAAWLSRHANGIQRHMSLIGRGIGALFVGFGFKLALTNIHD
jgi:threonine/homoserine/homoserine lactone efflux protein